MKQQEKYHILCSPIKKRHWEALSSAKGKISTFTSFDAADREVARLQGMDYRLKERHVYIIVREV